MYKGTLIKSANINEDWQTCAEKCRATSKCEYWAMGTVTCKMYSDLQSSVENPSVISGDKWFSLPRIGEYLQCLSNYLSVCLPACLFVLQIDSLFACLTDLITVRLSV